MELTSLMPARSTSFVGATRIERGKQNTALEDEAVAQVAGSQPGEKSFKDVELQQFLGGPPCPLRLILEVEVGVPGWRSP